MKNQESFSLFSVKSIIALRSTVFSVLMFVGFCCLTTVTAFAQMPRQTTVEVGLQKSFRLAKEINLRDLRITVRPEGVATAWYDENLNRFRVQGLQPGVATITFAGTYRVIAPIGPSERADRFVETLEVKVLPREANLDSRMIPIQVTADTHRDYLVERLLGSEFGNKSEKGVRWRNVSLLPHDGHPIAAAIYDENLMKIRITGKKRGEAQLTLVGERLNNGVWQTVQRVLRITVVGGRTDDDANPPPGAPAPANPHPGGAGANNAPDSNAPSDPWLEGIQRRYNNLKASTEQIGDDDSKRLKAIRDLEAFIYFVQQEIDKEADRRPPDRKRNETLSKLRDAAQADVNGLREKDVPEILWQRPASSKTTIPGQKIKFRCTADPSMAEYGVDKELGRPFPDAGHGIDIYEIRSGVCFAAVHAGLITFASGGVVTIETRPGLDRYPGSVRNGVETKAYSGQSLASFVFVSER